MSAVTVIAAWAVLFLATHLVISSGYVRPRLIAAMGAQPYRGVYSLVAFATLGPLIYEFAYHKHAGPLLWNLRAVAPARWLAWLLMLIAFVLFVASLLNPSPALMGAPARDGAARGVLKITRHPGFVAFGLFGVAHLLMNAWLGDVIFFGMFPVLGIVGGVHQDQRKLREIGAPYRSLMAETSFIPGAALLDGRQKWTAGDTSWTALACGAAITVAIVLLHPYIFGGLPLG
jgi:uncharacterized membrane protein